MKFIVTKLKTPVLVNLVGEVMVKIDASHSTHIAKIPHGLSLLPLLLVSHIHANKKNTSKKRKIIYFV